MTKACKIFTVLLLSVLLLALAACGDSALLGKYIITNISDDPDGLTFADLDDMYKEEELIVQDNFYFEFSDNSRFTLVMFGKTEMTGQYEKNGNTLTLIVGEDTDTAEISGKTITWTYETGAKIVFQNGDKDGLSTGAIIGIVVGSVAFICVIGIIIFAAKQRKKE